MATGTNSSGGSPSDPRELSFHRDRVVPQAQQGGLLSRIHPGRILFSLILGALAVWFHQQAAERLAPVIDIFIPSWLYYLTLVLTGTITAGVMNYWLRPQPTDP